MFDVELKLWLSLLIDCHLPSQSTSIRRDFFLRSEHSNEPVRMIRGSPVIVRSNENPDSETTNLSPPDHSHPIHILTKILTIFLIVAAAALVITMIIALAMVYMNCSRPSRIHQQFPIEYLAAVDMIHYSDETLASASSVVPSQASPLQRI